MKHNLVKAYRAAVVVLVFGLIIVFGWPMFHPAPAKPDYSYTHWMRIAHVSVPACTLDGSSIKCKESGLIPTRAQIIAWESYVLWDSCYEFHSKLACKELTN